MDLESQATAAATHEPARQQRAILRRGLDKHTEGEVSLELSHNKAVATTTADARGQARVGFDIHTY